MLSPEFVALHKRRRITTAISELTAEQGYEATKIADIVRRAGVARKTLYDNFEGKEEVFLAAFDAVVEDLGARIEKACAAAETWPEKVEAGLGAFLAYVEENPAAARMCMVESLSATPAATERYEQVVQSYVDMTRSSMPDDERLPSTIDESLVGGVTWIVCQRLRRDETEGIEELLPELTGFMLAPFEGAARSAAAKSGK